MFIQLLSAADATNNAPSGATAGVALRGATVRCDKQFRDGSNLDGVVLVKDSAGSGTMTCKLTIWGYHNDIGQWAPFKALNAGADITETASDDINYSELVAGIGHFDRVYMQVVAIAGTSTALNVYLFSRV